MELLLVSAADGRLPSLAAGDHRLAEASVDEVVVVHRDDLRVVISANPGKRVLAVCSPDTIQEFVAEAIDVEPDSLAAPDRGSLTCVRASRSGAVNLIYYNDCLHLPPRAPSAPQEIPL